MNLEIASRTIFRISLFFFFFPTLKFVYSFHDDASPNQFYSRVKNRDSLVRGSLTYDKHPKWNLTFHRMISYIRVEILLFSLIGPIFSFLGFSLLFLPSFIILSFLIGEEGRTKLCGNLLHRRKRGTRKLLTCLLYLDIFVSFTFCLHNDRHISQTQLSD